ncbi:MAG: DUF456 domain-containing protein [Kiritimatiellales bacterium]|nr:DUF456 domain-containing protein [Kiritimatiellales bacterium]
MIDLLLFILAGLLCGTGVFISALAFSGTWLVLAAALITFFTAGFPTPGTLIVFALLCIGAEIIEALAGYFGVQKRGGSKLAGLAALVGGLLGAVIGSGILPIIGTVLGMLIGSFALAFLIEWNRLKHHGQAAQIAVGAVWARLGVMFLKTLFSLGMSIWLLAGLMRWPD